MYAWFAKLGGFNSRCEPIFQHLVPNSAIKFHNSETFILNLGSSYLKIFSLMSEYIIDAS